MRRSIIFFLATIVLCTLCGCSQQPETELILPVAFYYHNDLDSKDNFNEVFVAEQREGSNYQNDHLALINLYLAGPNSEKLTNPFPEDLIAQKLEINSDTASIVLSTQITKLTGIELTLACSCLSLTLFELTRCNRVEISVDGQMLAGQPSVLIHRDDLIFTDNTLQSAADPG